MNKKFAFILVFLLIVALFVSSNPRIYNGLNTGIAWDFGGLEIKGDPGIFLCEANYNPTTEEIFYYRLAEIFPSLVVDC